MENQPAKKEELFSLPADLTEWVNPCALMDWVEEEVDKLDWKNEEVQNYLRRHPEYRPKMMLSLLTFAYATQSFGAEEIVRRCYSETTYRLLSDNQAPTPTELGRFRKENRGLLRGLLYQVIVRAVRERFGLGQILLPPGFKKYVLDNAVERLDIARHMDSIED